jgi:integrase
MSGHSALALSRSPRKGRPYLLSPEQENVVGEYRAYMRAAGLSADKADTWGGTAFFAKFANTEGWHALSLDEQLSVNVKIGRFVVWMISTQRLVPAPEYVVAHRPLLGRVMRRAEADFYALFQATARALGFNPAVISQQWSSLAQVAAVAGKRPQDLSQAELDIARAALCRAGSELGRGTLRGLRSALFGVEAVLFHSGVTGELPRKRVPDRASQRAEQWATVARTAPVMVATMQRYLEQISLSLRPGTVVNAEAVLREFASFIVDRSRATTAVADIRRSHVETYKSWLAERATNRGAKLHRHTVRDRLKGLRCFFDRIIEWGWEDAPARPLVFASDLPIKDEPLPRFLDDPAAAKLLRAARGDHDPFVRVAVELLARTGLRKGELLGLTVDAVVQIGSAYWLRVPVGKLHNDRYVPLHPQLKELLDEWLALRPEELRSKLMFVERGRPVGESRVDNAVRKAAQVAGIGHASPHQLRHTLATQAVNRGMSLEAIAALLGHRSLRMTLVYARIADRTVADEYFSVSEKVEAMYGQPQELPADAEGAEMAKLRREMSRRMLGNGWCARPVEMDCHFESICESCSFFVTTVEFKPTLERQKADAAAKGQVGREKIFDGLLARLEDAAS